MILGYVRNTHLRLSWLPLVGRISEDQRHRGESQHDEGFDVGHSTKHVRLSEFVPLNTPPRICRKTRYREERVWSWVESFVPADDKLPR